MLIMSKWLKKSPLKHCKQMKLPRKRKERRMIELEMTKAIAVKFRTFISYRSAVLEKEINSLFL